MMLPCFEIHLSVSARPQQVNVDLPQKIGESSYTSLPQCNASASGRYAQCEVNPYFAGAGALAGYRRHRRVY
jgi:hypothetical protein